MNKLDQPQEEEWTLSMTFQWLEEAAEFLCGMGALKTKEDKSSELNSEPQVN